MSDLRKDINDFAINKPVEIIAVSKFRNIDMMEIVYNAGIKHFGENRGQEVKNKRDFFRREDITLSFIGKLQKNKVKYLIGVCNLIQSIDSIELAKYVNERFERENMKIDILLEINISKEESKTGILIEDMRNVIKEILDLKYINLKGLMTIGPLTDNKEKINSAFKTMYESFNEYKNKIDGFNILSMGMTDDYIVALKNGSNMIRIGRKIFEGIN
ncbi:YggS family pyridoxal phosphate-dependent enzyme [candidate division WOR-3 bacterium]|nr:YggS family pyridoxal phosphate-dependent enzyme [candidate division WOR-3 bacterium]